MPNLPPSRFPDLPESPNSKPARPWFSSGPCAKRPGWALSELVVDALGRSHRVSPAKDRLKAAIDRAAAILQIPATHRLAIVPASDTGAVEMAMWNLLGERPVDMLAWESFGEEWVTNAVEELKLDARILRADYGQLPDLSAIRPDADLVFTWNGTTSGVRVPDADWIAADRTGLTICDATSAAFAQEIAWDKCDVVTFSWQKALGGEAAHGMLALSERAIARLETWRPDRPIPKILRLTKKGKVDPALFEGSTINTPSLLATEDWLDALGWAENLGGLNALIGRANANLAVLEDWVAGSSWAAFLCEDPAHRSNTSVCLKLIDPALVGLDTGALRSFVAGMAARLEAEQAGFDIAGYRGAPPGLRVWCGATVEREDLLALTPWLDWAYAHEKRSRGL
jgi:phosphoserine aminotransferase